MLKTWRDKEDAEADMASLEKALREMGREDIADNFKQLAYSSYSKDPVVVVETHRVTTTHTVPTESSAPGHRRISEFLDTAGETDDMFGGDDAGSHSPRTDPKNQADGDEVFTEARRSSPEPITEESVIVVEKHRVVDEDGNVIEESHKIIEDGNEVTEDREKLLQDFFGNDKGVLEFFANDANKAVENRDEETEI